LHFHTFLVAPPLQVAINEFGAAISAYGMGGYSADMKMSQVFLDILCNLMFPFQEIDCDIACRVIDEEQVILVSVDGSAVVFAPNVHGLRVCLAWVHAMQSGVGVLGSTVKPWIRLRECNFLKPS